MPSFQRRTGAQRDVAELCYISALHQTQPGDVRRDGSIRDEDVALYLRSRQGLIVTEEEVRRVILPGLAGIVEAEGEDAPDSQDRDDEEEDDEWKDNEVAAAANGNVTCVGVAPSTASEGAEAGGDGSNDDGVVDLAELTALLLTPALVKLAEAAQADEAAGNAGQDAEDGSDDGGIPDGKILESALHIILDDVGPVEGSEYDPANGIYPELTPELLRTILIAYGEDEIAANDGVIEEMMAVAIGGDSLHDSVPSPTLGDDNFVSEDELNSIHTSESPTLGSQTLSTSTKRRNEDTEQESKVRLDPAMFARVLTADLGLLHSSDEMRVTTNYQDVLDAGGGGANGSDGSARDREEAQDVETGCEATVFPLKRFRFPTGHLDFSGGRYASKAIAAFLWASFIMFVFNELVLSGDLSSGYVYYMFFVETNPCRFISYWDQNGNPPFIYNHTFPDGTQYEDWVDVCEDYTDSFGMKIAKSTATWVYRFIVYMLYGLAFIGLGGLGNSTQYSRFCSRRAAAMVGFYFVAAIALSSFFLRTFDVFRKCVGCYYDDAAFKFTALSYFVCACLVSILQLLVIIGLGDNGKIRKLVTSELYSEAVMKRAAAQKTMQMIRNGLVLHSVSANANDQTNVKVKTSSLGKALLKFEVEEEWVEKIGGFFWCWKHWLNGDLFYKEGIQLSSRVIAVNVVQGCIVGYIFIVGVLLTRFCVYLWEIGNDRIENMVNAIMDFFNVQLAAEKIGQAIDLTGLCEELPDPAVCDNISMDTIKSYISSDAIQAFITDYAYRFYPKEAFMVRAPLVTFTLVAGGAGIILFSLYIPSVCTTILRFRCGELPLFDSNRQFRKYRSRVDSTTFLLGCIFWTGLLGPCIIGFLVMLPVFLLLWQATRTVMISLIATILGIGISVAIRELFAHIFLKGSFCGFYRRRVNRVNVASLALESVTIGLAVFYALTRVAKVLVASLLYISRIDTPLLSMDLNIGPLQDHYPKFFRQELLVQESHKHPWVEVLGKLYMMKYRYREAFLSSAGYSYRLIFAISLLPYLRKYRLHNRAMGQDEEVPLGQKLKSVISEATLPGVKKRVINQDSLESGK